MDIRQQNIIKYSDVILEHLLKYKEVHPDFTFSLRQRDFAKANGPKRLENGQWFQGSDYIFVPLFRTGDSARKIKTFGFAINFDKNGTITSSTITISFKGGVTNKKEIDFHKKLAKAIGIELNRANCGDFFFEYPTSIRENLDYYLNTTRPIALRLLNEFSLTDKYIFSETDFQKYLVRINEIRNNSEINYWIFQGSPKIYDAVSALNNNAVSTWTVSAHKDKIKEGDKFILWLTGSNAGCYALGTIASEVAIMKEENSEMSYYLVPTDQIENTRVKVIIDKNLSNVPVLWENIKGQEVFKDFKAGNQGTNFTATKAEYVYFNTYITSTIQTKDIMSATNLNQILFGPPGTGKTFNTINEALKIVDPTYYKEHQNDRKKLTDKFKELLIKDSDENKGQITFCTFHQSFSYEDFVEGIKPKTTEAKSVYYKTEPGVFKNICELANSNNSTVKVIKEGKLSWNDEQFKKASFYKISLGEANNPEDREIYEYCRDNNYISIGFGEENDFSNLTETEIVEKCTDLKLEGTSAQQLNYFIHYLKKNNYVIISNGNKYVRAIGKVVGDYEFKENSPIRYSHFRKVEWVFVDENIPVEEIYDRALTQKTIYKIDETGLKQDFFTNQGQQETIEAKEDKKFVLIIDEINRGNVSAIFGELITLIEKDKRAGCDEELEVTLPYSKQPFKVPNNVYIVGTMNTADKSIEALDTALRRRFSFKEFAPKPHLIKTEGASSKVDGLVGTIDLENLLNTINTRIEKLIDKDHSIGHSYFLKVDNKQKLIHAFKNEIIPLLEEYFFGDYGKIGLVLGSSFVEKISHKFEFAAFKDYDTDIQEDLKDKAVFRIKNEDQWDFSTI